jgi:hypothetical protein
LIIFGAYNMIPKTYKSIKLLENLPDNDHTVFIQTDYELSDLLESLGMPKKWRKEITGAIVLLGDGDFIAVWLTEWAAYYDNNAYYHPLPYYRPRHWTKRNLPEYWLESNVEYNQ